jgi:hypothetical protein
VPGGLLTATLLPSKDDSRPLALGFLYPEGAAIDPLALVGTLDRGIAACMSEERTAPTAPFMMAV